MGHERDRRGAPPAKLSFAIIGAGMAGILSAIKLIGAGDTDFTIYEKAECLGGTWRENTYPGIACDVPSHLYCYSFAPNPQWSHQFSPGGEIEAYLERVAADYDIIRSICFGEEIIRCTWANGRWTLETAGGHTNVVDVVIAATGVLHHPLYPDIDGIDSFGGEMFHSARWNHDAVLDGARIGVIGTGSTAVQITSALTERAGHYSLFQRTAQWIMPQANPAYSDEERAGFAREPEQLAELHTTLADLFANFARAVVDAESPEMQWIESMCLANLEDSVADPSLRERLRPDYRAACKRLVISPDFYQAIQHPNAELVTAGITGLEPGGVRTDDDRLHELDVLVLATGFHADAFMRPMDVIGRNGVTLAEAWADRPHAYYSISIPEFPNFFMLNGPNGPVGNFSLIEVAELQYAYVDQLVDRLRRGECREISATRAATDDLEAARVEAAKNTVWVTGCRSWYLDDRGIPATWPWSFDRFREEMATPVLDAYETA